MTTVTKVFIVLQLVFSIALGTMAIVLAGQTYNWKDLAEQYQAKAQAAETRRQQADAQWAVERAQLADNIVRSAELAASLSEVSKSLEVELARAERLEARNNELLATATDLRQRNLDLNERVKDLTTTVTLQQQQVRALQQQRYALEQQLAAQQRQGQPGAAVAPAAAVVEPGAERVGPLTPAVAAPIRGQIELLEGGIAQISVGSDDGVSKGMVFVIYRDGSYLGRMTIEEVEPNRAAGTLSQLQGEVRVGDKVADETRFQVMQ